MDIKKTVAGDNPEKDVDGVGELHCACLLVGRGSRIAGGHGGPPLHDLIQTQLVSCHCRNRDSETRSE
jgi:hypothetical protein